MEKEQKKISQIKADISTPKADINQLPWNTEKERKGDRGRGGGHQSMIYILWEAWAEKVYVHCILHVHVRVCVCYVSWAHNSTVRWTQGDNCRCTHPPKSFSTLVSVYPRLSFNFTLAGANSLYLQLQGFLLILSEAFCSEYDKWGLINNTT